MGEDIGEMGGVFQCTAGLTSEFGARRVIETPISEACIGGCAVGAAATGLVVPIVEVQIIGHGHANDGQRRQPGGQVAPDARRRGAARRRGPDYNNQRLAINDSSIRRSATQRGRL
mmetsp:Transcript_42880/g.142757  ORF Transcript_42880/g.142757 Transcript_42880/m.142757 type:complete len:116 (-) Transcript_42880:885-1232(-)